MLRFMLFLLAFTCLSVVAKGDCVVDNIATKENFDIDKNQGKWYEIYYKKKSFYTSADLWVDVYQTYSIRPDGSLAMDFVARFPETQKCNYLNGTLKLTSVSGKLNYTDNFGSKGYWVLDTDYTGYSVVYGCSQPDAQGMCTLEDTLDIWVFSRTMTLTSAQLTTVTSVLQSACVDISILEYPAQTKKCEVDPGPEDCNPNSADRLGPLVWLCMTYFLGKALY